MTPATSTVSDKSSLFSYDGEYPSDSFNLGGLQDIADAHFGKPCLLVLFFTLREDSDTVLHDVVTRRIFLCVQYQPVFCII